jgi:SAM-dependent methyltransferase
MKAESDAGRRPPTESRGNVSFWQLGRVREPELMDDPGLPAADHRAALDALATLNAFSGTAAQLARSLSDLAAGAPSSRRPLRVVDVACGGGDLTLAVEKRLRRRLGRRGATAAAANPAVEFLGIDFSQRAIERARGLAAGEGRVEFAVRDVLTAGCPPCDLVISSLFLHHLDDGHAADVLRSMATAARLGGAVSDLVRSPAGLFLATVATTLLVRSRVARIDGPLSVRAARTPAEYRELLERAGIPQATIRRTWPERVVLEWKTTAAVDDLIPGVACA